MERQEDWANRHHSRTHPVKGLFNQPTLSNTHPPRIAHRTDRLGCRWVLEDLEKKMSALRQRQPKAPRAAVWRDMFASDPAFYDQMLRAADLGPCGYGAGLACGVAVPGCGAAGRGPMRCGLFVWLTTRRHPPIPLPSNPLLGQVTKPWA